MLRPNTDYLELQLSQLEHQIQDDLHLLSEGGVTYFSAEELCDLLLACHVRMQRQQRLQYGVYTFLALAIVSLFLAQAINQYDVAYAKNLQLGTFFALSLAIFIQLFLYFRCESTVNLQYYRRVILGELATRNRHFAASCED